MRNSLSGGGYLLAGVTESYDAESYDTDIWIIKIDRNGTEEWNQTYGGTEDDSISALIEIPDGSNTLVGSTRSEKY